MKYKTGSAFRRALEDRIRSRSLGGGTPIVRLRMLVGFDRLLARLRETSPEAWVLKGGFALQLRFGASARTTKDLDLLLLESSTPAWDLLRLAAAKDLGDWFGFEVGRTQREPMEDSLGGERYPVHSLMDGRTFENFHVDIGVGDPIVEAPEILHTPDLLAFADIDPVPFPAYPLTQQLAEKLHAYTRPLGGAENTRVRDFVDMLLIASMSTIDGNSLSAAIRATFVARFTHPLPGQLPAPPSAWGGSFRRSVDDLQLNWQDIGAASRAAQAFLNPVLEGVVGEIWDPATWSWK